MKTFNNIFLSFLFITLLLFSCSGDKKAFKKTSPAQQENIQIPEGSQLLFDGQSLKGWEITDFGTQGLVEAYDGKIVINYGDGCSGITWKEEFPKVNYEVSLDARKTAGNDFFCGITFPVNDEFCSFIVGGWGGPVLGLSCIDGLDASENETKTLKRFDKNIWYHIQLQVSDETIIGWIDGEKLVDFTYTDRELTVRPEVELSKPFGICTWITSGELKNIILTLLD